MEMQTKDDPRKVIYDKIGMKKLGVLLGFELFGNRVLVGIYERPKVTKSGIHLADVTVKEDEFQGKAACVLMLGHSAFKSDETYDFGPDMVSPGDWVALHTVDGRKIVVNGQLCRIVRDQDIAMKIPAPDQIF